MGKRANRTQKTTIILPFQTNPLWPKRRRVISIKVRNTNRNWQFKKNRCGDQQGSPGTVPKLRKSNMYYLQSFMIPNPELGSRYSRNSKLYN